MQLLRGVTEGVEGLAADQPPALRVHEPPDPGPPREQEARVRDLGPQDVLLRSELAAQRLRAVNDFMALRQHPLDGGLCMRRRGEAGERERDRDGRRPPPGAGLAGHPIPQTVAWT
jgi:hypothetical protein